MDLDTFNYYMQLASFIILLASTLFVLCILRVRLDVFAYIIITLYLLVQLLRLIPNELEKSHPALLVLWPFASNMIWAILFYFVFEMETVRLKV